MKRLIAVLALAPLIVAAKNDPNVQAAREITDRIIAGQSLPEEILDRRGGRGLPDLDQSLARAKGCEVDTVDRLQSRDFAVAVQWQCKGRKTREMPSPLIVYVSQGKVTRITTALVM